MFLGKQDLMQFRLHSRISFPSDDFQISQIVTNPWPSWLQIDDFRLHVARLLTGAGRRAIRVAMKTVICIICRNIIR
ncbi:hypothetical protein T190_13565 [Sinorhizobium meliloti CCBAU 01290]|nr:hypothetical protein T190_13565 [Sinorhizobium meliloti CCBAU 01290]